MIEVRHVLIHISKEVQYKIGYFHENTYRKKEIYFLEQFFFQLVFGGLKKISN